jgi:DNA-binding IclR family transcriptional regulator
MDTPKYPIESVDNALRLLLQFKQQEVIGVSDAGKLLGVAPSTAHRLIAMLQYRGFASQDEGTRVYRAGPALLEIGLKAVRDMSLRRHARPIIEQLSAELDETIHLLIRDGAEVWFVDGVESSKVLRVTIRTGMLLPAHCTAGGKALLARMDQSELRRLYPTPRLEGLTPNSTTRRSDLERELAEVRDRGYAVNAGESEADVSAIGVAIVDRHERARGAVAVALPTARFSDAYIERMSAALIAAADKIGAAIE